MEFITFMAGAIVGGSIFAVCFYLKLKGRYEKEVSESYTRGYKNGREIEQRSILDYIEQLRSTGGIVFEGSED